MSCGERTCVHYGSCDLPDMDICTCNKFCWAYREQMWKGEIPPHKASETEVEL